MTSSGVPWAAERTDVWSVLLLWTFFHDMGKCCVMGVFSGDYVYDYGVVRGGWVSPGTVVHSANVLLVKRFLVVFSRRAGGHVDRALGRLRLGGRE